MNPDSVLASILNDHGMISENQIPALVAAFPNLPICAKMGCSTRFRVPAKDFLDSIKMRVAANPEDYIREAFLDTTTYDALCGALGIQNRF